MGDLGNSVPFATTFPANDRFDVKCRFNATRSTNELKISRYEEHDIYLSVPETCTVSYAGNDILVINFDVILTVRLVHINLFRAAQEKAFELLSFPQASTAISIRVSMLNTKLKAFIWPNTP
jgi:hypothetical protein